MKRVLNKITEIRKAKKIVQSDISKALEISQAAYAKFESGDSITIDRLYKIAEILNVSVSDLLEIDTTSTSVEQTEKLIAEIETLKKQVEEKSEIIELLKNERFYLKEYLVSQMVESFSFDIGIIDEQISKVVTDEEKEKLINKKEDIKRFFKMNKERYFRTGFISQTDFDNYYNDMRDFIRNLPDEKTLNEVGTITD